MYNKGWAFKWTKLQEPPALQVAPASLTGGSSTLLEVKEQENMWAHIWQEREQNQQLMWEAESWLTPSLRTWSRRQQQLLQLKLLSQMDGIQDCLGR